MYKEAKEVALSLPSPDEIDKLLLESSEEMPVGLSHVDIDVSQPTTSMSSTKQNPPLDIDLSQPYQLGEDKK